DDAMFAAVKSRDPLDADGGSPEAVDPRAGGDQEPAEVDDFGFAGGGFDGRRTIGEDGCREHVAGTGDGAAERPAEVDFRADEAVGLGDDVAPLDANPGPERPQAL